MFVAATDGWVVKEKPTVPSALLVTATCLINDALVVCSLSSLLLSDQLSFLGLLVLQHFDNVVGVESGGSSIVP